MSDQLPPGYVLDQPDASQLPDGYVLDDTPPAPAAPTTVLGKIGDAAASFASGVGRGAVETAMLPVTIPRLAGQGIDYLTDKTDGLVQYIMGNDQRSPEYMAELNKRRQAGDLLQPAYHAEDTTRKVMDDNLYAPRTTPGKYAQTVGEFIPAALMPAEAGAALPTIADRVGDAASRLISNAVVPGVASEAAGQATEGTPFEPVARLAGGLAGNVGTALHAASNAPEAALRRAIGDTPPDWAAAQNLQNNRFGVSLTGPEAVAQASGGASALPNLQRVVEGSTEGRAATAPFFAARPGQVDQAVGGVLDQIAPQSPIPSVLGPRASENATTAIRGVEQQVSNATNPLYTAADTQRVDPQIIRGLLAQIDQATGADATGILHGPLNDLRNRLIETPAVPAVPGQPAVRTPVTGPNGQVTRYTMTPAVPPVPAVPEVPITDIGNLDRTRKYFRDREGLISTGEDALTKEQSAAINGVLSPLDQAMVQQSPDFAAGKALHADMSRNVVQPVAEGPLGRVADATNTAGAAEAVLPRNPLVGSRDETVDAITRLAAEDPQNTAALARQALADRYSTASTQTQGGSRDYVGAKFAKDVAGNDTRREVLDAVLQGLNSPARGDAADLMQVLEATGRRSPVGSNTSFNTAEQNNLGAGSPMGRVMDLVRSGGTSIVTKAGDAVNRARLRNSVGALADMFTDPHSVELIQAAYGRRAPVGLAEALARTVASSGSTTRDRSN